VTLTDLVDHPVAAHVLDRAPEVERVQMATVVAELDRAERGRLYRPFVAAADDVFADPKRAVEQEEHPRNTEIGLVQSKSLRTGPYRHQPQIGARDGVGYFFSSAMRPSGITEKKSASAKAAVEVLCLVPTRPPELDPTGARAVPAWAKNVGKIDGADLFSRELSNCGGSAAVASV
jgi:hypothetical protein